jgi:hypothetical protein
MDPKRKDAVARPRQFPLFAIVSLSCKVVARSTCCQRELLRGSRRGLALRLLGATEFSHLEAVFTR